MAKITYTNKVVGSKFKADDANEIKESVNDLYDELEAGTTVIKNQDDVVQTADFKISGTGEIGTSLRLTSIQPVGATSDLFLVRNNSQGEVRTVTISNVLSSVVNSGSLINNQTSLQSSSNFNIDGFGKAQTTAKANGEQFYSSSGENFFGKSNNVIEAQQAGAGADFTPSNTVVAIKFTTSSTVSFLQGIVLSVKKTGSLTATSNFIVKLYSDSAGLPNIQIGSSGTVYSGRVTSSYTDIPILFQNVSTALSPNTTYWAVITRTESGGAFVFNSTSGSGVTYQGATTGTVIDTGIVIGYTVFARSNYGSHFTADYSHAIWGTSITGVGVRGDSTAHYGGFFQSVDDSGVSGISTNSNGVQGSSTNGAGVAATTASSIGFAALDARNSSGATALFTQGVSVHTQSVRNNNHTFQSLTQANHTGGLAKGLVWQTGTLTAQTASTEANSWTINGGSRQWNTGAIATQRENYWTSPTYSFVASSTITNAYTAFIQAPVAGTNAIITNNWALGLSGNLQVAGTVVSTQYNVTALNTAPATATSTGTTGEIRYTATHIYLCTATNTWVRAALATF